MLVIGGRGVGGGALLLIASDNYKFSLWNKNTHYFMKWGHIAKRHNGVRRHARAKHYEYFVFENCTETARVYWSKIPFNHYTFIAGKTI